MADKPTLYTRAEDLHPLHWERVAARDPGEAAAGAGCRWDGQSFLLPLLGQTLRISTARREIAFADDPARPVSYTRGLVALAYLAQALDAPPSGRWASFRELPGGEGFFRGPHALPLPRLAAAFGNDPSRLDEAARALGGLPADAPGGADAAADLPALPRIGLRALVWGRSQDFAASAQLLTDARAHLHLPLDVLWALANLAVAGLAGTMDESVPDNRPPPEIQSAR